MFHSWMFQWSCMNNGYVLSNIHLYITVNWFKLRNFLQIWLHSPQPVNWFKIRNFFQIWLYSPQPKIGKIQILRLFFYTSYEKLGRNLLFGFWRSPIKCQKKIDSLDPGDAFWLLDRYSSLKSRIFRKFWKLSKIRNFDQKNGFFPNFEILAIFNIF